jgi:amidophosphoribosyltransferase
MLDRLGPKKIVVVSSAPQIRYPDCYGIDMAKLEEFIAFRAALSLLQQDGVYDKVVQSVYEKCKQSLDNKEATPPNHVKAIYERYSNDQISIMISALLKSDSINAEVDVIFQTVEGLHKACPKNLGDWYFTGDYPTPGGCRVVNKAFVNFVERNNKRAY